jgi:COP9 signalosome complex subunit 7
LALSKSATSPRAAADLIARATSAPNTYIFTELLQTPQIQALASSDEFAPYLTLLQIFSHGTYSAYTSASGLPELTDAQRLKLRQLSLLSLAKRGSTTDNAGSVALDYASLQTALDLPTRQALEELVISAIYAGLLKAQLNPKASLVQINSVSPLRDVAPTSINNLLSNLQSWAGRCEATLQSLSCQMTQLRADADRRAARSAARTQETRQLMENEQKRGKAPPPATTVPPLAAPVNCDARSFRRTVPHDIRTHTHNNPGSSSSSLMNTNDGGGGGKITINTNTTTNNEIDSVLTVGGGSSFLPPGGQSVTGPSPTGAAHLQVSSAVKRGSSDMGGGVGDVDGVDDGMDVDEEGDGVDGAKKASKRKLGP